VELRLGDRVLGFGYLAPLLADPDIEEIQVIGGRVRIYRHGRWELVEHLAPDDAETLRLVRRLLAPGDRIDESSPEVESTLPDGSRLTAVIPPETEQVTLTIRRYVVRHHRLADLGTLPSEAVALVESYARGGASIVTAGPGGAGKTTLLRCIVAAGDPSRTICSIEDVRELALHQYHPAAIPLYAHRANIEGAEVLARIGADANPLRLRPVRWSRKQRQRSIGSCGGNGPPVPRNPPFGLPAGPFASSGLSLSSRPRVSTRTPSGR
jgi:pilus assembly protein CpaF